MDKYGMIESVNEVSGGNASSLAPNNDSVPPKAPQQTNTTMSLGDVVNNSPNAMTLSPNVEQNGVGVNAPIKPPTQSAAMDNLKKAMLAGAARGLQDFGKNPLNPNSNSKPKNSFANLKEEVTKSNQLPMPKEVAPNDKPPAAANMDKPKAASTPPIPQVEVTDKGVKRWKNGNTFVELPQDLDISDSQAVASAVEFSKQMMEWMNDEEEELI